MNREYIQNFQVTEATRIQDFQEICRFLEQVREEQYTVFVHGRGKRKSVARNTWNYSGVFWNDRQSTIGTPPFFRGGIITARLIRMPHSCT